MRKTLYLLFTVNFALILGFWTQSSLPLLGSGGAGILLAGGRLFGLLAVYFVLLQFLFMGRALWIERVFGLDKVARIHHYNGFLAITFVILHPIFIVSSYALSSHKTLLQQYLNFVLTTPDLLHASLAAFLFVIVVFLSITIVWKHLQYEFWYIVHMSTYLAILLAWGHQISLGGDFGAHQLFTWYWYLLYGFVALNVMYFRFTRSFLSFLNHRFYIKKVVPESEGATSIYITGANMATFMAKPGQFIIVRFLAGKDWWQAHPFSLSFVPKDNLLRLTIKNSGDFTSQISGLQPKTYVYIDGPFGTFTLDQVKRKKLLFIAGGVGITPIRSLLEAVQGKDSMLLYANRTKNEVILGKEIEELTKEKKIPLHYVFSQDPEYPSQHINKEILQKYIPDIQEREIFLCGPVGMMNAVRGELSDLGISKDVIHFEKFSLQ